MKRNFRIISFLICQFAFGIASSGQISAGAARPGTVTTGTPQSETGVQEKLFVHTDKTVYLTGETCWMSLYCLNAADHRPLDGSRVAYIELLNRSGQPVVQTKMALDSGFGSGSIVLPPTMATGKYQLRGYTAWMQNRGADFFFSGTLTVINTLHGSARDVTDSTQRISLQFFPEGGSTVAGLRSRIACRVSGAGVKPGPFLVEIRNRDHKLLNTFGTNGEGLGRFDFTPESSGGEYAVIAGDTQHLFRLPAAAPTGFVMSVDHGTGPTLTVSIAASSSEENKTVFLACYARQRLSVLQTARISQGAAVFQLQADSLQEGISVITLMDEYKQPIAERLIFRRPSHQLKLVAATDASDYARRSPVNITLASGDTGTATGARLSAAVFRLDTLQPIPTENIVTWLLLNSELPGLPVSAARFVNSSDDSSVTAMDNIMLTSGWRRFRWSPGQATNTPSFRFLPEIEGPLLSAHIVNRSSGLPAAGIPYLMLTPGRYTGLNTATSDANGDLHFAGHPFANNDPVIIQPRNPADSLFRIEVVHPFSDSLTGPAPGSAHIDRGAGADLTERHLALQVQTSFRNAGRRTETRQDRGDSTYFYGSPDRHFHLDSYTRYVTMEEVLREFVEDLRIRKEGKGFHFYVRNTLFNTFFENEPLILLDGVPVSDPSRIVALDPLKMSDIDIVTHRFIRGTEMFDGVVIVHSATGEAGLANLDPSAVVVDYNGLQEKREFASPDYNDSVSATSTLPDYRTTLWWSPNLRTGKAGKMQLRFYSGDLPGRYALVVQGISASGLAGYDVRTFTIRPGK